MATAVIDQIFCLDFVITPAAVAILMSVGYQSGCLAGTWKKLSFLLRWAHYLYSFLYMANKILLIEDDPNLLEMYRLKFVEEKFDIITATDGEKGLELALKENPEVILLDVMLPKMDGFAVLMAVKKNEATKNIPVLMLSNLGQKIDVEKGKELGAIDYIVKASLTPGQVVDKARQYLTKK